MKNMYDRLRTVKGKPVYEILAKTKEHDSYFVVYRETLDGKRTYRNLDFHYMTGYTVNGTPESRMHPFWNNKTPILQCCCQNTAYKPHIKPLLDHSPDFIYTFLKSGVIDLIQTWHIFKTWLKYPKMEILLNMGFFTLASDNNFLKMNVSKQKEIVNWYIAHEKDNPIDNRHFAKSKYIIGAMKNKCSYDSYKRYLSAIRSHFLKKLDYPTYKNIVNKKIALYDFMWYRSSLETEFPERLNDPYWTNFKDVDDFHRKENLVNEQIDNRRKLELAEKRKKQVDDYRKATQKYAKWNCNFNGLHVYVPRSIKDIEVQADKLNQCLVDNDYISRVIDKQLILVFIKDNDKPLATASFFRKNMELDQFYGNELDRNNCLPSKEAKNALDAFIKKYIAA